MKLSKIPIAAIALLTVGLLRFALKNFTAQPSAYYSPFLDGILVGVALAYALYYGRITVTAWINNKREEALDR